MFYNGCVGIPKNIFLSFTIFSEFWESFLNDSVMIHYYSMPSMLAVFPFYSVILGFWSTTDSFLLLPWVLELVRCQSLRGLVLSFFLIIFSFWCCLPESPLLTFHSEVSLGSWPQLLAFYLFWLSFWLSFFLSFFPSEQNPFLLDWRFS